MLITLLNDGTMISIGYDHVLPSPRPEKWNLRVIFLVAAVLGVVSCGSSLLLVWAALDSPNEGSLFREVGLPVPDYGQIVMIIYLNMSISDFLTLFSARTNPGWFWSQRPGKLLLGACAFSLTASTVIACVWPEGSFDEIEIEGLAVGAYKLWALWVWLFCIAVLFVQDALKVLAYVIIYKYDIFQARTAALVNLRDAAAPGDKSLGPNATGRVEKKLLGRKVDGAIAEAERIARESMGGVAPPALQRVSASLATSRASIAPVGVVSAQGVDARTLADVNAAAAEVGPYVSAADQAALQARLAAVNAAAGNLQRVSAVLTEPEGGKK